MEVMHPYRESSVIPGERCPALPLRSFFYMAGKMDCRRTFFRIISCRFIGAAGRIELEKAVERCYSYGDVREKSAPASFPDSSVEIESNETEKDMLKLEDTEIMAENAFPLRRLSTVTAEHKFTAVFEDDLPGGDE